MTTQVSAEPEITIPPELMPRVHELITEDDTPVDNIFSEKQQRLLVEPLYTAWRGGLEQQPFIATANVGMFALDQNPALVPDAMLSLDVQLPADLWEKGHRSYFFWLYGKPPEVVIEVVSNTKGGEDTDKVQTYARMRIAYYVIFDPENQLKAGVLRVYALERTRYLPTETRWFDDVGLGITLWEGTYEGHRATWLRWCDEQGNVIPTGAELAAVTTQRAEAEKQRADEERQRAEAEKQRADEERQRADEEHQRAEAEKQRADEEHQRAEAEKQRAEQAVEQLEQLKAQLRAAGIEPQA